MPDASKIRVLIIDDSIISREIIARGITTDRNIEVVGTAADPYEASEKIGELNPDVLTLDINMPKMNGLDFLKKLMAQYPLPVVVISGSSAYVFEALNAGAVDYVVKPEIKTQKDIEIFIDEMISKIKIAATANLEHAHIESENAMHRLSSVPLKYNISVIAIGASTGGTEAILEVLKPLPPTLPGIVIVQHMPPVFTKMYAERLNGCTRLRVKEAQTGDLILPGTALVAPGDAHIRVKKSNNDLFIECFQGDKVNGHCPAVDVMFQSVATQAGKQSIGIILTGMGYDGAKGLLLMRRTGAHTIGQDEETCVVYGMPKVAYDIGAVEKQCPLASIPEQILKYLR